MIQFGQPHRESAGRRPEDRPVAELRDVAARWRAPLPALAATTNVVLFPSGRREGAATRPAPEVSAAERPAPPPAARHPGLRWTVLLLLSAAAHASFYLPFGSEPPAMASVGEVSISVDLVLGANQDAGPVPDGGVSEATAPPAAQAPEVTDEIKPIEKPPEKPQEKPVEKAEEVQEKKAPQEKTAPPLQVATVKPAEEAAPPPPLVPLQPVTAQAPAPAQVQAVPLAETGGELLAAVNPEQSTELKAVEVPPEPDKKPAPKKPEKEVAKEKRRDEPPPAAVRGERNNLRTRSTASTAAGGIGRGRSDADTNYRGRVAAQLSRHKRFPAEARSRGVQGTAAVTFSIDGAGKVTSVALVRPSGVESLDHEATAMVRRSSPFPPPPGGRAQTFTVPVSFRLN